MTGLCKVCLTHRNVVRWFKRKSSKKECRYKSQTRSMYSESTWSKFWWCLH